MLNKTFKRFQAISITRVKFVGFFCLTSLVTFSAIAAPPPWGRGGYEGRSGLAAIADRKSDVSPFSPGSSNLSLNLGQVFLMGDLANYSDNLGAQLNYTYGVSDMFGFDSSVGYSSHSEGGMSMTTILTGLRTNLSWYDKVIPYAVFGLGFYMPSYRIQTALGQRSFSPVQFGLHLGPGIDLEISKMIFFGTSLTVHNIFGTEKTLPDGQRIQVGGTYAQFLVHAGVTF